ncbi:hypothetical protein FRC0470_00853 [Corynebacterium diphtheriae]|nr:hypothetical protein FRC0432_02100 [Corynebacterium diphtheriae]CAB0947396.1 hypothetical protein FRC0470_00853 [Corynebacterium diphtheriae]
MRGVAHAGTAEQSDGFGLVDGFDKVSGLSWVWVHDGTCVGDPRTSEGVVLHVLHGHIAGEDQHGYAFASHGRLDGVVQDDLALECRVGHFAVAGALSKEGFWVGFLEEV